MGAECGAPGLCLDVPRVIWVAGARVFFVAGEEIGLGSEPELIRDLARPGGWNLDSLDSFAREAMTADLTNRVPP
jgi:hypothetical protein